MSFLSQPFSGKPLGFEEHALGLLQHQQQGGSSHFYVLRMNPNLAQTGNWSHAYALLRSGC